MASVKEHGKAQAASPACHPDLKPQATKVDHELPALLRQRIYGIACGYFDGNDAAKLGHDPVMKLACHGQASEGQDLASWPTRSWFENAWTRTDLMRAGVALARTVLASLKQRRRGKPVRHIPIDLDPVCDPAYGEQPLTFFNGYYDTWCYEFAAPEMYEYLEAQERLVYFTWP